MKPPVIHNQRNTRGTRSSHLFPLLFLPAVFVFTLMMISCNTNHTDPKDTVDNAMNVNEQKAEDSVLTIQSDDADFIVHAANSGVWEVSMAKVAKEKSSDEDVKTFADKMIKDHAKLNSQIKHLADSLNITLPASIGEGEQKKLDKLKNMAVAGFDKAYINMMVKAHSKDVKHFQKASKEILVPGIHHFIIEALPILNAHQKAIEFLDKSKD